MLKSIWLSFGNEVSLSAIPGCLNCEWLALHGAFCNSPHRGGHIKISIIIQSDLHTGAVCDSWAWDSPFCWPWLPQSALGSFCDSSNKCSVKGLQRLQLLFLLCKDRRTGNFYIMHTLLLKCVLLWRTITGGPVLMKLLTHHFQIILCGSLLVY